MNSRPLIGGDFLHLLEVFDMQYLEAAGTINLPSLKRFIAQSTDAQSAN